MVHDSTNVTDTLGGIICLQCEILTEHMTTQATLLDHRVFQQTTVSAHAQHADTTAVTSLVGERASTLRPRSTGLLDTPRQNPRAPFGSFIALRQNSEPTSERRGGEKTKLSNMLNVQRDRFARERKNTCTGKSHQFVKRHVFSTRTIMLSIEKYETTSISGRRRRGVLGNDRRAPPGTRRRVVYDAPDTTKTTTNDNGSTTGNKRYQYR